MHDLDQVPGQVGGAGDFPSCEDVREQLPLLLSSGSPPPIPVERHLADCPDCTSELRFLGVLTEARPAPPADLAARVVARALLPSDTDPDVIPFRSRSEPPSPTRWWTSPAAAAAVVVLAAGLGLVAQGMVRTGVDGNGTMAAFDPAATGWWAEEWLVAGAPYLDGISDETLALLAAGIEP